MTSYVAPLGRVGWRGAVVAQTASATYVAPEIGAVAETGAATTVLSAPVRRGPAWLWQPPRVTTTARRFAPVIVSPGPSAPPGAMPRRPPAWLFAAPPPVFPRRRWSIAPAPAPAPSFTAVRPRRAPSWMFQPERIYRAPRMAPSIPVSHVSGYVTEYGAPAAKLVRVHNRSTGAVIGEATSSAVTGSWYVAVPAGTTTYVVCFDEPTFNALIFDGVVPG